MRHADSELLRDKVLWWSGIGSVGKIQDEKEEG